MYIKSSSLVVYVCIYVPYVYVYVYICVYMIYNMDYRSLSWIFCDRTACMELLSARKTSSSQKSRYSSPGETHLCHHPASLTSTNSCQSPDILPSAPSDTDRESDLRSSTPTSLLVSTIRSGGGVDIEVLADPASLPELSVEGGAIATAASCISQASPSAPHTNRGSALSASQWPQTRMRTGSPRGQWSRSTTTGSSPQ